MKENIVAEQYKKEGSDKCFSISIIPGDRFGCGHYRCFNPAISLSRLGIPAHLLTFDRINMYEVSDVLIIQRPAEMNMELLVEEAHANGLKVIFELDDLLWDIPKWNQSYPFWTDMRLSITESIMKKCDQVVTSTPYLASKLSKFNPNVKVVPNAIFDHNFIDLPKQMQNEAKIIIGWVGSSFHLKDTEIFNLLIPKVLDKYKDIGFLMMGESPPKALAPYRNRIISLPFVEPIYYHTILSSFTMHLGLAPLVINEFNKCKSSIKAIEYLYTNTYPICSEIEPYIKLNEELDEECKFHLIPSREDQSGCVSDWLDAIDYCIENIDAVMEKAAKGKEWILGKYNIESEYMIDIYKDAYFINELKGE